MKLLVTFSFVEDDASLMPGGKWGDVAEFSGVPETPREMEIFLNGAMQQFRHTLASCAYSVFKYPSEK